MTCILQYLALGGSWLESLQDTCGSQGRRSGDSVVHFPFLLAIDASLAVIFYSCVGCLCHLTPQEPRLAFPLSGLWLLASQSLHFGRYCLASETFTVSSHCAGKHRRGHGGAFWWQPAGNTMVTDKAMYCLHSYIVVSVLQHCVFTKFTLILFFLDGRLLSGNLSICNSSETSDVWEVIVLGMAAGTKVISRSRYSHI